MLTCLYCGSSRLQTTGGDVGNPFDRRQEKTICLDCGRTVGTEQDIIDSIQNVIRTEKTTENNG